MILDFLKGYTHAVTLDDKAFNSFFPSGVERSDFLLFNKEIVCEVKEIKNFQVSARVERLAKKEGGTSGDLKRDLYNTIRNGLRTANRQIRETKTALKSNGAFGLIILENLIPKDLSVLSLLDAANKKVAQGLESVDGVLCLDFVNAFVDGNGSHIRPSQILVRDSVPSKKLYELVGRMLTDFSANLKVPLQTNFHISEVGQAWNIDTAGKYRGYDATLNIHPGSKKE